MADNDAAVDGLIDRALSLTTCHLSDALDRCGLPPGGLPGIRPLEPAKRAAGFAFPVQLRAADGHSAEPRNYLDHIPARAFVVLAAGHDPSPELAEEIKAFVRDRHSAYAYPRLIEFVPDLPKTLTGKIRRIELRQSEQERVRGSG